jgi:hypothetical protein
MRPFLLFALGAVACCLAVSAPVLAGKPDPDKYPLRVHIFRYVVQQRPSREFKSQSDVMAYVDGMGQADLFENREPRGFQFRYSCTAGMMASERYGTFPARWKKKESTLEILLPEAGKPWNMESCNLQTEMRNGLVFYWKNGEVAEERSEVLKDWMVKHRYDPENGKEEPVMEPGESETSNPQIAEPE